ncbi:hypothetical protein Tco_1418060 [Tanacetum coccineum]
MAALGNLLYPSNVASLKEGNCMLRNDCGSKVSFKDSVGPTRHGSVVIDNAVSLWMLSSLARTGGDSCEGASRRSYTIL